MLDRKILRTAIFLIARRFETFSMVDLWMATGVTPLFTGESLKGDAVCFKG